MGSDTPDGLGDGRRLHAVSLLFGVGAAARSLLLPGLVVLLASRSSDYEVWAMVLFVPAVVTAIARYWSYRYWLGPDEIVIREGILTRNERHIPYARIQNLDLVRNPLHRFFDVAVVRLETGSGAKAEADMRVLSRAAVDELRSRVFHDRASPDSERPGGAEEPTPLVHLSLRDLVIYGLVSNRGIALLAAAAGVIWQSGVFDFPSENVDNAEREVEEYASRLQRAFADENAWLTVLLAVSFFFALLVVLRVLSVLWAILKLHDFRVTQSGESLRVEYGLLTKVTATIPRRRIQILSIRETRLQRWFGLASIEARTTGGFQGRDGGENAEPTTERIWLAPTIPKARAAEFVGKILPGLDLDGLEWRPIAWRAWRRLFQILSLPLAVTGVVALLTIPPGALLCLLGVPAAFVGSRRWVAANVYALTEDAIAHRSGIWSLHTTVVRFGKLQSVRLVQSPFDRRHGMARVALDSAGCGPLGPFFEVPYLDRGVAEGLTERLYREAGRTPFQW